MEGLKDFYKAVREDAPAQVIEIEGKPHTTSPVYRVEDAAPKTLTVHTLTGLVNYVRHNVDELNLEKMLCHVESPSKVSLFTAIGGNFLSRKVFLAAELIPVRLRFGTYLDSDEFNIMLQSAFVDYPNEELGVTDKGLVLKYISSIVKDDGINLEDNGVSQSAVVKTGIVNKERMVLPNPVTLRPYRTFTDVPQPASKFVFRLNNKFEAGLWEADGGAWQGDAMKAIKNYLEFELPLIKVIA